MNGASVGKHNCGARNGNAVKSGVDSSGAANIGNKSNGDIVSTTGTIEIDFAAAPYAIDGEDGRNFVVGKRSRIFSEGKINVPQTPIRAAA
jgi:hypothetical protein